MGCSDHGKEGQGEGAPAAAATEPRRGEPVLSRAVLLAGEEEGEGQGQEGGQRCAASRSPSCSAARENSRGCRGALSLGRRDALRGVRAGVGAAQSSRVRRSAPSYAPPAERWGLGITLWLTHLLAAAEDIDPLSDAFQVLQKQAQIESLEHQLGPSTTARRCARRGAPTPPLTRAPMRWRSAADGCGDARDPAARRGSQPERAPQAGVGEVHPYPAPLSLSASRQAVLLTLRGACRQLQEPDGGH